MSGQKVPKILFFDSGVGGLSVFYETYKLNYQAAYYYLFDHQCFPYGNKSEVFLRARVASLLEDFAAKIKPDLIVIACNTASTTVLTTLRSIFSFPIVGVVPAVKPAALVTNNHHIALLATPGTVNRDYTDFLINEFAYDCKVMKIGSEDLVRLAEDTLLQACKTLVNINQCAHDEAVMNKLRQILDPILRLAPEARPDVVILGCTHFPLLKEVIQEILGSDIKLVDSGEAIARRVRSLLGLNNSISENFTDAPPPLAAQLEAQLDNHEIQAASSQSKEKVEDQGEHLEYGPREAFYTGSVSPDEFEKLFSTFAHFGFDKLESFDSYFTSASKKD